MIPIILLFSLHSSLAPNFLSRKCLDEELIFWIPVAVLVSLKSWMEMGSILVSQSRKKGWHSSLILFAGEDEGRRQVEGGDRDRAVVEGGDEVKV